MGLGNAAISRWSGSPGNTTYIQGLVENQLGPATNWTVRYSSGSWVAVWANDSMAADEGHILLLPRSKTLITPEALQTVWYFVEASKANLSFDPSIGFLYQQVTIVGDATLENGVDVELEQQLREEGRKVERIAPGTAEELIKILNERLDDKTYFQPQSKG